MNIEYTLPYLSIKQKIKINTSTLILFQLSTPPFPLFSFSRSFNVILRTRSEPHDIEIYTIQYLFELMLLRDIIGIYQNKNFMKAHIELNRRKV